jgi:hypothetical protein
VRKKIAGNFALQKNPNTRNRAKAICLKQRTFCRISPQDPARTAMM